MYVSLFFLVCLYGSGLFSFVQLLRFIIFFFTLRCLGHDTFDCLISHLFLFFIFLVRVLIIVIAALAALELIDTLNFFALLLANLCELLHEICAVYSFVKDEIEPVLWYDIYTNTAFLHRIAVLRREKGIDRNTERVIKHLCK